MLLLEHHAKALLKARCLPVPHGALLGADAEPPSFPAPWVVKAQVASGGRGKAGGIAIVDEADALREAAKRIGALTIGGHPVHAVRVEEAVLGAQEVYLGFLVEPASAQIAVMVSAQGGIGVEEAAHDGALVICHAAPNVEAVARAATEAAGAFPVPLARAVAEAASALATEFFALEAALLEVNPLFVRADGSWILGDVRLNVDESALPRQPELAALVDANPAIYGDTSFKRSHGFDLVVIDPFGTVGLVTTGAGLSMQLIDEMRAMGLRPYNFCDIRSGGMKSPDRLVEALRIVANGPQVRCVLVNIFAGITDSGDFAELLLQALPLVGRPVPPLVVRLVGNGQAKAEALLAASGGALTVEPDLERAIALCHAESTDA